MLAALLLYSVIASVHAAIEVFACEPEWAALVRELGGEHIKASSATTALQDVHHIQARPSLIAKLRRADLLICTGAGLEEGWLPVLQRRANNPRVQVGATGYLEVANLVRLRDRPARVDRAEGDIHPLGNPHLQLDPRNIRQVAEIVTERLVVIDPAHTGNYQAGLESFSKRWEQAIARWEQLAEPLRGMPVVVHHNAWVYLQYWLELEVVGTLEPKPGIPPSSTHLSQLLAQLEQHPARVIIRSAYQSPRASEWLSQRADIPALVLPSTVGGSDVAQDLFGLFDDIIGRLLGIVS
ncbi:MAG: zinc ABC transporter substrate-binding protein [Gammaproteobacteria bacterium]|jgi:zinc/manganese transport system substrate-binding protein|nr:zinc ABC transporter substrate-binding protein [Gammaproteobacteria bacterium]